MNMYMYACVYICVCTCMYVYVCVCLCAHVTMYLEREAGLVQFTWKKHLGQLVA